MQHIIQVPPLLALLVWDEAEETYIYQQQFDIPMIRVEAPE
jgi:hypothetical protein